MIDTWQYLQDRNRWTNLSARYSEFGIELPRLVNALYRCFQRDVEMDDRQIGVYGLGRLCVEDLLEILFLCEHGFAHAGLKLLRGMFERNVTATYIADNPDEAQLFHDYMFVQLKRLRDKAEKVYGTPPGSIDDSTFLAKLSSVRSNFSASECDLCHMRRQLGWSKLSLDAMAVKASEIWKKRYRYAKSEPRQLERAYFYYADVANVHIHASMYGIWLRLKIDSSGNINSTRPRDIHEDSVVASAHAMALIVLETQNQFFALGLDTVISELNQHYVEMWSSRGEQ